MKVFISWSGPVSGDFAVALRKYLPCMIPGIQVFMSRHDVESGSRWSLELSKELAASNFGLICLTRDNLGAPWLLFEAGAIAKHLEGRVCGLLLSSLGTADVVMPLAQFQHRSFCKAEFMALVRDMNRKLDMPLEAEQLSLVFEKFWPDVEHAYTAVSAKHYARNDTRPRRNDRDLLEEILVRVREISPSSPGSFVSAGISEGDDVLSRPLGYDSLGWYTLWKFPRLLVSEFWQAQLLGDLMPGRYPTIRQIDEVVTRAEDAVAAYAAEAPDKFKHGTDFITKSLGFVDLDFRTAHSFGRETIQAFAKYSHLVKVETSDTI